MSDILVVSLGFSVVGVTALVAFGPTPRTWQRRVICFRACLMTVGEMWRAAWEKGKNVYPEMERRARIDA